VQGTLAAEKALPASCMPLTGTYGWGVFCAVQATELPEGSLTAQLTQPSVTL
jgi:hypothetical protein